MKMFGHRIKDGCISKCPNPFTLEFTGITWELKEEKNISLSECRECSKHIKAYQHNSIRCSLG